MIMSLFPHHPANLVLSSSSRLVSSSCAIAPRQMYNADPTTQQGIPQQGMPQDMQPGAVDNMQYQMQAAVEVPVALPAAVNGKNKCVNLILMVRKT